MPNRLAEETSPYLLQHANNPVDWYPWSPEALGRAKAEGKPIFLSIGYSACHWCHVMEHESFENPDIAKILNDNFVSIKVDREERPDLDHIYMDAVQSIAGRGGWPMSVFLTTDLEPFFGGTYWPPTASMGMPGFDRVLAAVMDAWQNRRAEAVEQAGRLAEHLRGMSHLPRGEAALGPDLLRTAAATLERIYDHRHGGFGGAPKFPHPMDLQLLLRVWRREHRDGVLQMVTNTLDKMSAGGVYDQLGGGFHRYSVDDHWLVPHFEKMLYDNALLSKCLIEAYQATGNEAYATTARETFDWVLREMTHAEGCFYSTQDADSEGVEGKFYVWSTAEIRTILGDAAKAFCYCYDVSDEGNFEGENILNRPKTLEQCGKILNRDPAELAAELAAGRDKLLAVRNTRVWPGLDDKVLVSWNALMIDSLALAAGVLNEPRYLEAATRAARFILDHLRGPDGRLLHTCRGGQAKLAAYLDDYTSLINALVTLYEASFDESWIDEAVRLADIVLEQFVDPKGGGFFYTAADHEQLISRHKDIHDSSVPSGNAMAATSLVRLGKLCGRGDYLQKAQETLDSFATLMLEHATATGQMLLALDMHLGPTPELVLLGKPGSNEMQRVVADLRRRFVPNKLVALRPTGKAAATQSPYLKDLFAGKQATGNEPTLFVCRDFTCEAPIVGVDAILAAWEVL